MRRGWMVAAALLPVAALAQVAGGGLSNYPTQPAAEPYRETVHGVAVDDPYRWMERADKREELATWVNDSSRHTTTQIAALPGRAALLRDLQAASRASDRLSGAQEAGGRLFFYRLASGANIPVLMVREGGRDRVLLDPMAGTDGKSPRAISSFSVSPDGRFAAIHLAEGGAETGAIRLYDVASGQPLPDVLEPVWGEFRVGWIDNDTIVYTRMAKPAPGGDTMQGMVAYLHRVGTATAQDRPLLGAGLPANGFAVAPAQFPRVLVDPTTPWVVAVASNARAEAPFAIGRLADVRAGKPQWTMIADYPDRVSTADIVGDTFYYITSRTDENGELRAIDLAAGAPSLARSRTVMRADGRVLSEVVATTSGLYVVTTLPSAASEMWFLPRGGGVARRMKLPVSESISDLATTPDRIAITFAMGGYTRADSYYRAVAGQATPLGLVNTTPPGARERVVVEETARSADGTRVPLTLISMRDRRGPSPTVIDAYGSYGVSGSPFFTSSWLVWNQRGGVYAYCHTRGGGELGEGWHRAGMQATKPNAHADLIACGERLVQLGYATPRTLGIFGASAGGLLVTPVGIKRPDLFAAVVTRVGIVNPIRLAVANNGPNQFGEMGDPATAAGFRALAAQDSTLLLPKAAGGTSHLFTVGLNDRRVDPWMSAKLVAMMRAQWGERHLVLIRSDGNAGHGIGSTRDQALEERADIYAFFLNRFGAPGFVR